MTGEWGTAPMPKSRAERGAPKLATFQPDAVWCSTNGASPLRPTAHAPPPPPTATARREAGADPVSAPTCARQARPFQCRIRGSVPREPTAHRSSPCPAMAESHSLAGVEGAGTTRHLVPSQRTISGSPATRPTAQTFLGPRTRTSWSTAPLSLGPVTAVHAVPFHRSISSSFLPSFSPTAQASVDKADTASSWAPSSAPGGSSTPAYTHREPFQSSAADASMATRSLVSCAGETRDHFEPFQRSISGVSEWGAPTAHALCAETATASVSPCPAFGPATTLHRVPFQCSMRFLSYHPPAVVPTAHTSSGDDAETALRESPPVEGLGLATTLQAEPSQCSATSEPPVKPTYPTAHTSSVAMACTAVSVASPASTVGVGTCIHGHEAPSAARTGPAIGASTPAEATNAERRRRRGRRFRIGDRMVTPLALDSLRPHVGRTACWIRSWPRPGEHHWGQRPAPRCPRILRVRATGSKGRPASPAWR